MAKKIIESFVDDLDGSEAAGTVAFGIDGTSYEIDLSEENEEKLRKALAPFLIKARPVRQLRPTRERRGGIRPPAMSREQSAHIRRWANENGLAVSERGRIPRSIVEQYEAAH